jgi:hypothetical protein
MYVAVMEFGRLFRWGELWRRIFTSRTGGSGRVSCCASAGSPMSVPLTG